MDKKEIRDYLKKNLTIEWGVGSRCTYKICLKLEGEIISEIPFEGI